MIYILISITLTVLYLFLGLGVTRVIASWKQREIRMMELFFWPIALVVLAAIGDVN